jgi:hypothetical protein
MRPSADAVRSALLGPASCPTSGWRPARTVLGAGRPRVVVAGAELRVAVTAAEGAVARVCLLRGTHTLAAARRVLASRRALAGACVRGSVQANRYATLRLGRRAGAHTLAVRLSAESNPARSTTAVRVVR